ncbi:hypothetical protein GG344DRAFT_84302 [Lentinula edodes]|nr:hypothetical protein GG344DRAFT_84302 [Lentinula edodes]
MQDLQLSCSLIAYAPQSPPHYPSPGEAFPPLPNPTPAAPPTLHIDNLTTSALTQGPVGDSGDMKELNEGRVIGTEVEGVQHIVTIGDTAELDKDESSTDDEGCSNEGGDPSDDDAEPVEGNDMDVDHAPVTLSPTEIHSSLSRFNILVEPVYHLVVCTECAIPIRLEHLHTHQRTKHFKGVTLPPELRLPSSSELTSLLTTLGANQPLDIPVGPIPRIQGGPNRAGPQVPCHPLSANRKDRRFVEVIPTTNPSSNSLHYLQAAADSCGLLEHDQVFTLASNEREKNAVFAQSRWDEVLEGVNLTSLIATVSTANRETFVYFKRLKLISREYYKGVGERLPTLPVLTRRYLLSSSTSINHSDALRSLIAFLIVHLKTPVERFPVPLHPEVKAHLESLFNDLADESTADSNLA